MIDKGLSCLTDENIERGEYNKLNVAILGCGGIDSLACQSIAASGIKKFILPDFGKTEEDN